MKKMPIITVELREAVENVLAGKVLVESWKKIILDHHNEWHASNVAVINPELTYEGYNPDLTKYENAYEMSDECFASYHAHMQAKADEVAPNRAEGTCPLLCAESDVREAKRAMVNAATYFTEITASTLYTGTIERWRKFEDILIKLVVNAPKSALAA